MITNVSNKVVRFENYIVPFYTLSLFFMAYYSMECIEYDSISPTVFLVSIRQEKSTCNSVQAMSLQYRYGELYLAKAWRSVVSLVRAASRKA